MHRNRADAARGAGQVQRRGLGGEQPRRDRRLAAYRRGWGRDGLDGQGRGRPERPDVADHGRRRRAQICQSIDAVKLVMGDTDHVPFDMGTFGSRTTPTMVPQMRRAAAAARALPAGPGREEMERRPRHAWNCRRQGDARRDRANGWFRRADAWAGSCVEIDRREHATDAAHRMESRRQVGAQSRRPRLRDRSASVRERLSNGPGCSMARSFGPPRSGLGSSTSTRRTPRRCPDVKVVRDGDFVGVVAPTEIAAHVRLAALAANLDARPIARRDELRPRPGPVPQGAPEAEGRESRLRRSVPSADGSVNNDLAAAHVKIEAALHGRLHRPRPAGAARRCRRVERRPLTVWTGTQRPFGARSELAQAFHLPEDRMPRARAGYGQRLRRQAYQRGRRRGGPACARPRASR